MGAGEVPQFRDGEKRVVEGLLALNRSGARKHPGRVVAYRVWAVSDLGDQWYIEIGTAADSPEALAMLVKAEDDWVLDEGAGWA